MKPTQTDDSASFVLQKIAGYQCLSVSGKMSNLRSFLQHPYEGRVWSYTFPT